MISDFRDALWEKVREIAINMPAVDVIRALEEASNKIWDLGLDTEYHKVQRKDDIDLAAAFDVTWMTAWMLELKKLK